MSKAEGSKMETPPTSPPRLSHPGSEPPDLAGTMSLSPETVKETAKIAESPRRRSSMSSEHSSEGTGHRRSATPSTPVGLTQLFSTPGRSGAGAPAPAMMQAQQHHHPISDLTPVISNSNAAYVDSQVPFAGGSKPGMPGLAEGDGGPRGLYSRAAAALAADDGDGLSSSAGRLRQRPVRMPLPRSGGLPPAKRSSSGGGSGGSNDAAAAPSLLRLGSVASSDSSLQGEHLRSPSTSATEGVGGMFSQGERLAMPSYSLYSDDESSVDTSGNGSGNGRANIFQQKEMPPINGLSPIELRPDRRFFSFQGSSQYKRAVGEDEAAPHTRLETIPGNRPPASPVKGGQPMLATMHSTDQKHQYQPVLRGQHGVKELAKAEELNAIFKEPRRRQPPHVVSPNTPASALGDVKEGGPMMIIDQQQLQQPMSYSYPPREEEEDDDDDDVAVIPPAYPVESQWSIPSIRLANHVDQSGSRSLMDSHNYSYGDFSEYTDDDGASLGSESYYSFLADDDDNASLGSKSSLDASARKRKSRLATLQFLRKESIERLSRDGSASSDAMEVAQSSSFLERVGGISIEGVAPATDATTKVAKDANVSSPPSMIVPPPLPRRDHHAKTPPSLLGVPVNVPANDDGAADIPAGIPAAEPRSSRRSRHRGGARSRRKEGAAEEWIRDLRGKSDDVQLIAESASSKFMTGEGAATALGGHGRVDGVGGVGGSNAVPDVTKALGMPHPLCRSSTIEAGPFTVHRGIGDNAVGLSSGNSIALTSSGSGD